MYYSTLLNLIVKNIALITCLYFKYYLVKLQKTSAMRALLLFIGSMLLLIPTSYGQWVWQNPTPTGESIYAMIFVDSHTGYASGGAGHIIKTTNGGFSWYSIGSVGDDYIMSLSFLNENKGFAFGNEGNLYYTIDGGNEWTTLETGFENQNFVAGHFFNSMLGVIACWNGKILRTTDGGNSWSVAFSTMDKNIWDMQFVDQSTGYVCCDGGYVYKTTNGGANWTAKPTGSSEFLSSLFFTDANTGYACGFLGTMMKTTDGGNNWTAQTVGEDINFTESYLRKCFFTDANHGWVGNDFGEIFITSDGGTTWELQDITNNQMINAICATSVGTLFVANMLGEIYRSNNSGASWILMTDKLTEEYCVLYNVEFYDDNIGTAVGNDGNLLHTANGGNTWELDKFSDDLDFTDVEYLGENNIVISTNYGQVMLSDDGGETWETVVLMNNFLITSIFFTNELIGYAAGSNGHVFKTTNGGHNWAEQNSATDSYLQDIFFTNDTVGYAVGSYHTTIKTSDGGSTWQNMGVFEDNGSLYSVAFVNNDTGFVCGYIAENFNSQTGEFTAVPVIKKTYDGGVNWQLVDGISSQSAWFNDIMFNEGDTGYVAGQSGAFLMSVDAGETWETIPRFTYQDLNAIAETPVGSLIVVGHNTAILKNRYAPKMVHIEEPVPTEKVNVYPNPANNLLSISLTDYENAYFSIFDLNGRCVMCGDLQPNITISELQDGVYILEIKTQTYTKRTKFIKQNQ